MRRFQKHPVRFDEFESIPCFRDDHIMILFFLLNLSTSDFYIKTTEKLVHFPRSVYSYYSE